MLTIKLLGPPQILLDGHPIKVERRKSRALLYYLAAQNAPVSREHLLAFFWPEHDRQAAQQLLRTTLHGLRKAIGDALLAEEEALFLAADTWLDVRQLEETLARTDLDAEQLSAALDRYRGDFLSDFSLPDAVEFDNWSTAEGERLRRLAANGYTRLSRLHAAIPDYPKALEALDRALLLEPFQEDLQREYLRLLYLSGDRAGVIRRYDTLRKLWNEELGVPPMAETRALYDAILSDALPTKPGEADLPPSLQAPAAARTRSPGSSAGEPLSLPFTGRADELNRLRSLRSERKLVVIEGEPGIGKTRLAEEFIRYTQFETPPPLALKGACHELESALPYAALIEALRKLAARPDWALLRSRLELPALWLNEAARLLPELKVGLSTQAAPPADEMHLWEGLAQFLLALARLQPVLFFLDDLQWADASTLGLLGYLLRKMASPSESGRATIFFLAAARPAPTRSPYATLIQTLTRENRIVRLTLQPLSPQETASLAMELSPSHAATLAEWLIRNAEGNPYLLSELVRHSREHHILGPDGSLREEELGSSPVVPQTVYTLIQSRLGHLSNPARRVLDTAVAAGREFEFQVVARASALSETAALDALDELRAAGLVYPKDSHGKVFVFDHALTMEVAYQEVGELRHRLLHRHVAEAMESLYRTRLEEVAGVLAWHFSEGNTPERAAVYAIRAARHAARLAAWKEAISFYQIALSGVDDPRRVEIYLALGEAYSQAGELAQASEAYQSALLLAGDADVASKSQARIGLAHSLLPQGRFSEIISLVQTICASGRPQDIIAAQFLWGTALSIEGAELEEASRHLRNAEELLQKNPGPSRSEDIASLAQIKFEQGSVAAQQGDLERAISLYEEALAMAEKDDAAVQQRILAHNNIAYHSLLAGKPGALEHAQAGLALAHEKGEILQETYLYSTLGEIALAQGNVAEAEKSFEEGLSLAERLQMPERIAGLSANLGLAALRQGETSLAIHRLSGALAQADALGTRHLAAQIRLWLAPLLPRDEARATLAEARAIAESGGRRRLLEEADRLEKELLDS